VFVKSRGGSWFAESKGSLRFAELRGGLWFAESRVKLRLMFWKLAIADLSV
jgi:hypothetical protein